VTAATVGWVVFGAVLLGMAVLDLVLLQRGGGVLSLRRAIAWSLLWVVVASLFGVGILDRLGGAKALEFFTGYLVELSLSADNVFVFLLIFTYFRVPLAHQHKVLFWGILGALVMRGVFIAAGVTLIQRFHMVIYVFGALLMASGVKMAFGNQVEVNPERNPVLRLARRFLRVTPDYDEGRFFTVRDGRRLATPLLIVLLVVETTDLVFAVDSIPAVLAITQDPFIVFTSNVFAILGLRALYFALAGFIGLFRYLSRGIAAILVFVGFKMIVSDAFPIPTWASLAVIAGLIAGSVVASVMHRKAEPHVSE
jgi:tellurite resistance protein TerC